MIFLKEVVGDIDTNCYILGCETTRDCIIVDPGAEPEKIMDAIKKNNLTPRIIVNTHAHADHIGANAALGYPIYLHEKEAPLLDDPLLNLSGYVGCNVVSPPATKFIKEPQTIAVGTYVLTVIDTPGHSPGGISLLADTFVITGDTLFREAVGRTDLPGAHEEELLTSLTKLAKLRKELDVFPGHGSQSTMAHELKHNVWIQRLQ
jgi:glyoxylase-like metal-dependent hydrolase (beta-lactamase superfamily II)